MGDMKPILFNTEMVRAFEAGTKTQTRRVIKTDELEKPPAYRPGDVLYVRETWKVQSARRFDANVRIMFKVGDDMSTIQFANGCSDSADRREYDDFIHKWMQGDGWHPSIHMPKAAARYFARVTSEWTHDLQYITDQQARAEGCKGRVDFSRVWNDCYAAPRPVKVGSVIVCYESYPWEDIREERIYRGLPWLVIGNPVVRVYEFERITKEEALT